jgi:3-oxoacyl-(acyl-carrier-protein) synthase
MSYHRIGDALAVISGGSAGLSIWMDLQHAASFGAAIVAIISGLAATLYYTKARAKL